MALCASLEERCGCRFDSVWVCAGLGVLGASWRIGNGKLLMMTKPEVNDDLDGDGEAEAEGEGG